MSQADDREWFDPAELLAAVGQAVIATDPTGPWCSGTPAAERLYGWTADEAVGRNIGELTVPVVSTEIAADIMAALRKGVAWSGGFPVRRKDGTVFPALVTDSGIYRDGELVGIVGISANLGTALRPLLERSTDAAVAVRADAVITYASPAVGPLFGWDENAIIGSSIVPLVHAEDRDALAEFLTEVVRIPGAHARLELRLRRSGRDVGVGGGRAHQHARRPRGPRRGVQPPPQRRPAGPGTSRGTRRPAPAGARHAGDHRAGQGVPDRTRRGPSRCRLRAPSPLRP